MFELVTPSRQPRRTDLKALLAVLGWVATALEVMVEQEYHIALRLPPARPTDESEILQSDDMECAFACGHHNGGGKDA